MKNSTKYIWIVFAAIAVLLVLMLLSFRNIVDDYFGIDDSGAKGPARISSHESGKRVEESFEIKGFSELRITGGWDILVKQDDDYSVTADIAVEDLSKYSIRKDGDALVLELDSFETDFHGASATVHMADLDRVRVEGAVNLNFEGFDCEKMTLLLDGLGNIYAEDCDIDYLELDSNGAVNVDFKRIDIQNADVNLDGAGNVELNMTGGKLTGYMGGLSRLEYSGEVELMDVKKDGIGTVKHRE